jgi:hypothetical protein
MFKRTVLTALSVATAIVLTAGAAFASTSLHGSGVSAQGATFSVVAASDLTGSVDYTTADASFTGHCDGFDRYVDVGSEDFKVDVGLVSNNCFVPGDAYVQGPQGMEGDLKVDPGETLIAGYDLTMPGTHPDAEVQVFQGSVSFDATCVVGQGGGSFSVPLPTASYKIAANDGKWYPSGDQHDPSVWQGSFQVPDLCNGGRVRLQHGGTFSATFTSNAPESALHFRWHYAAHGTSGSWSGTGSIEAQGPLSVWMDLVDYTDGKAHLDRAAFYWNHSLTKPNKQHNFINDYGKLLSGDIQIT